MRQRPCGEGQLEQEALARVGEFIAGQLRHPAEPVGECVAVNAQQGGCLSQRAAMLEKGVERLKQRAMAAQVVRFQHAQKRVGECGELGAGVRGIGQRTEQRERAEPSGIERVDDSPAARDISGARQARKHARLAPAVSTVAALMVGALATSSSVGLPVQSRRCRAERAPVLIENARRPARLPPVLWEQA